MMEVKMPFSEKTKLEAKRKSAFRCVICQKPFVEVHHIIPQEEGGKDVLNNAAPLCSSCHDLYGGNPVKRKQIRQMRDYWFKVVEETSATSESALCIIEENPNYINCLKNKGIALYHVVFKNEKFEDAAQMILDIIRKAQKNHPNINRSLFLDIEGHKNIMGGFDNDMFELQQNFILGFLMPFLHKVYIPLGAVENSKLQQNNIPEEVIIFAYEDETAKHIKDKI